MSSTAMITFVAEGREIVLPKARLLQHNFFRKLFATDTTTTATTSLMQVIHLQRVEYVAASAALNICAFGDGKSFWAILGRCAEVHPNSRDDDDDDDDDADDVRDGVGASTRRVLVPTELVEKRNRRVATLISLFEVCAALQILWHAEVCAGALARYISNTNVVMILKSCIHVEEGGYQWPTNNNNNNNKMDDDDVSAPSLLHLCLAAIPKTWPTPSQERAWMKLATQHPRLLEMMKMAAPRVHNTPAKNMPEMMMKRPVVARRSSTISRSTREEEREEVVVATQPTTNPPPPPTTTTAQPPPPSSTSVGGAANDLNDELQRWQQRKSELQDVLHEALMNQQHTLTTIFDEHLANLEELVNAEQTRVEELNDEVRSATQQLLDATQDVAKNNLRTTEGEMFMADARGYVEALNAAAAELTHSCNTWLPHVGDVESLARAMNDLEISYLHKTEELRAQTEDELVRQVEREKQIANLRYAIRHNEAQPLRPTTQ